MKHFSDSKNFRLIIYTILNIVIGGFIAYFSLFPGLLFMLSFELILIVDYIKKREKRINDLTDYLQRINQNDYRYDLDAYVEGDIARLQSEIHKTTIMLKEMNTQLSNQKETLKQSLEDISHQLKTPLASLLILNELQDQDDELVKRANAQIQRLTYLVESLLKLVKLENHMEPLKNEEIDLRACVDKSLEILKPQIMKNNLTLSIGFDTMLAKGDFNKSVEAILNVLSNKVRYAQSEIYIESQQIALTTKLKIFDDGESIRKEDRSKVFERFYSGVNRSEESVGIGLSIAKEIMVQQKGNISIEDRNTFVFTFNRF